MVKKILRSGSLAQSISDIRYTFKHTPCNICGRLSGVKNGLCFLCRKNKIK